MKFLLRPDHICPAVGDIDLAALREAGITLLLADLDNTLASYAVFAPTPEVFAWLEELRQSGMELFVLSNNRGKTRIPNYCAALGVPYIAHAGKPAARSYLRAMEQMRRTKSETIMVGDQIFTDVLGAKNAGIPVILVEPIALKGNVGRYLRYAAELPFRRAAMRAQKKMNSAQGAKEKEK